jgi:hypothetical protein
MLPKHSVLCLFLLSLASRAFSADWRPITPEELALKQSPKDSNADAEVFFRDVRIDNALTGYARNVRTTYVRFKIFNDRGREKYGNVKLEYAGKEHIGGVEARTIHPDGTIVDVKKDGIFDKVEIKKGGTKVRAVSFAFPSVEPGSIIEYRYSEDGGEFLSRYIPLDVQSEYPVDEVTFHIKPATSNYGVMPAMRVMQFGCEPERGSTDSRGFTTLTVRNVPAYHEEPYSPPLRSSREWILVYYEENSNVGKDKYWLGVGRDAYGKAKEQIKLTGEIKQTSAEIVSKGKTDEEKLALLAEYCRKTLRTSIATG